MGSIYNLTKIKNIDNKNKKFCAWVVSNKFGRERNLFYDNEYKIIDSGGKFKNNIGHKVKNKIEFLQNYIIYPKIISIILFLLKFKFLNV